MLKSPLISRVLRAYGKMCRNEKIILFCGFVEHFVERFVEQVPVKTMKIWTRECLNMDGYKDYRQAEVLTAREVQEILKVGNKTVYRLFAGDCPFRVVKVPGGYRIHARSFFEWLDGREASQTGSA